MWVRVDSVWEVLLYVRLFPHTISRLCFHEDYVYTFLSGAYVHRAKYSCGHADATGYDADDGGDDGGDGDDDDYNDGCVSV